MQYRLNRALALTGICSRRKADELIAEGRVSVNGAVVMDFNRLVEFDKDALAIDGEPISAQEHDYIVIYKPRGIITTCNDEKGRTTIIDILPPELKHLKPIGRLDMDSEGLLILTNDGALAQQLAHPAHHVPKLYKVTVAGSISDGSLDTLRSGVRLSAKEAMTRPTKVRLLFRDSKQSIFEIVLTEGKNRQIRRMCTSVGHSVIRLVRLAIGELQLRQMEPGTWRRASRREILSLCAK